MRWIIGILVCAVVCGCYRKVYVPVERDHAGTVHERTVARVADTVTVAERCTVKIMPEGKSSVLHREVQRVRVVHDTVRLRQTDTVKIVQAVTSGVGGTGEGRRGSGGVWMAIGCVGGVAAIVALRRIARRLV